VPDSGRAVSSSTGWKPASTSGFQDAIWIKLSFSPVASISSIKVTISVPMNSNFNAFYLSRNGTILNPDPVLGRITDKPITVVSHTFSFQPTSLTSFATGIETTSGGSPLYSGRLVSIQVSGTGVNPFSAAAVQQQALDSAFTNLKNALQANPSADVTTQVSAYKTAIQNAFGVVFDKESSAPEDWSLVSLHFARLGMEATARAIEQWVDAQISQQSLCKTISRFDLFKRVFGTITLLNSAETRLNIGYVTGRTIKAFQRPIAIAGHKECVQLSGSDEIILAQVPNGTLCPAGTTFSREAYQRDANGVLIASGRQGVMTPNNLIHELGHLLDGLSGFGDKKIGSMENAIDNSALGGGAGLHGGYTRNGMGPSHLRVQFYEHAQVIEQSGRAGFNVLTGKTPTTPVPDQYLLFDLLDDELYALWQQPFYTNLYGGNARIDTYGINVTPTPVETAADAFLSWVRNAFEGGAGQAWLNFFASPQHNIGLFLRNAVIYNYPGGNVQFYKDRGVIPQAAIALGTVNPIAFQLRLTPDATADNVVGSSVADLPNPNVEIYGWLDIEPAPGQGYWLLVSDKDYRLVWVGALALQHDQAIVQAAPQTNI
jgi:hypothetical protein